MTSFYDLEKKNEVDRPGYKKRYGVWAGNTVGRAPDYTKCGEYVPPGGYITRQCSYKAVVDNDDEERPTRCRVHRDKSRLP